MERTIYSFALSLEDASQLSSLYGITPPVTRLDSVLIWSRGVPSARPEAINGMGNLATLDTSGGVDVVSAGLGTSGLDMSTLHISAKPLADVSWQRQY